MTRDSDTEIGRRANFQETGRACGLKLYVTDRQTIDAIASAAERHELIVNWLLPGGTTEVRTNSVAYSELANPCLIGVTVSRRAIHLLHSNRESLSGEQFELIRIASDGTIGGGSETLKRYRKFLESHHMQIIEPPTQVSGYQTDFNLAVVRTRSLMVPEGIYYAYA